MDSLGAWGEVLAWLLAGWMAHLGGKMELQGRTARIQRTHPLGGKIAFQGSTQPSARCLQEGSLQATRLQDCRTAWTSRLQGYKTRGCRLLAARISFTA